MKILNLLFVITGCLFLSACGDFLKEYSKELTYAHSCKDLDEVLIGNGYFKSESKSSMFSLSSLKDASLYYPWLQVMDDDLEEFAFGSFGTGSALYSLRPFYAWQQTPFQDTKGNPFDDPTWKKLYEHIGYLNVIIAQVKEFSDDPEETRNRVQGEAEFLRGACYYLLVNMYAKPYVKATANDDLGVPLNVTEKIESKYFSRDKVADVYEQIVKDLKNATQHLEGIEQSTIYRVNSTAAHILLSRVYLYMGEWELALAESERAIVLGCPLWDLNDFDATNMAETSTSAYTKVNYMNSTDSPEVLFTQGTNTMNLLTNDNSDKGRYRVSDELWALYHKYNESGQLRDLRDTCYFTPAVNNKSYRFSRKNSSLAEEVKVFDCFVIRTVEAYLNKAEAEAMLDRTDAVETLKTILVNRFKDGKIPSVVTGLSGNELVNFIREERRRELCFESHRWFDLRRYAVCEKYPETKEITHKLYGPAVGEGVLMDNVVLKTYGEDAAWVMPIPTYEIDFNKGNMVDNERRPDRPIPLL